MPLTLAFTLNVYQTFLDARKEEQEEDESRFQIIFVRVPRLHFNEFASESSLWTTSYVHVAFERHRRRFWDVIGGDALERFAISFEDLFASREYFLKLETCILRISELGILEWRHCR